MAVKNEGTIKQQLRGKKCDHPRDKQKTHTNRKGKKFRECDRCGAFLKWL